jgi:hypothetical protein
MESNPSSEHKLPVFLKWTKHTAFSQSSVMAVSISSISTVALPMIISVVFLLVMDSATLVSYSTAGPLSQAQHESLKPLSEETLPQFVTIHLTRVAVFLTLYILFHNLLDWQNARTFIINVCQFLY